MSEYLFIYQCLHDFPQLLNSPLVVERVEEEHVVVGFIFVGDGFDDLLRQDGTDDGANGANFWADNHSAKKEE